MLFPSTANGRNDDLNNSSCHEMMTNNCGKKPHPLYGLKLFLFPVLLKIIYNAGSFTESYANSKCNIQTVKFLHWSNIQRKVSQCGVR